jgi:hypothetical protein
MAAVADHRVLRVQLEDVKASLDALQAVVDAADFTNVSLLVARIRERAELPPLPGQEPQPGEGKPEREEPSNG